MAGPIDFAAALQRKYDILQQQANAASQLKGAQANQLNVQSELAPDLAQATIARQGSAASADDARAGFLGTQAKALNTSLQPLGADAAKFARLLQGGRGAATRNRQRQQRGQAILQGLTTNSGNTQSLSILDGDKLKAARERRRSLLGF